QPERCPRRAAGRLDQLDEDAVARARVDERDRPLRAAARRAVDQLEAVDLEPEQCLGQVRDLKADMVEALALAREEARAPGRVVGRLNELDLRLADTEKGDPDPVRGDVHDRLELQAEKVAPE